MVRQSVHLVAIRPVIPLRAVQVRVTAVRVRRRGAVPAGKARLAVAPRLPPAVLPPMEMVRVMGWGMAVQEVLKGRMAV